MKNKAYIIQGNSDFLKYLVHTECDKYDLLVFDQLTNKQIAILKLSKTVNYIKYGECGLCINDFKIFCDIFCRLC